MDYLLSEIVAARPRSIPTNSKRLETRYVMNDSGTQLFTITSPWLDKGALKVAGVDYLFWIKLLRIVALAEKT